MTVILSLPGNRIVRLDTVVDAILGSAGKGEAMDTLILTHADGSVTTHPLREYWRIDFDDK